MKLRRPFLGVGPGRCGTQSLAKAVAACRNTCVTHEGYLDPWDGPWPHADDLINEARQAASEGLLFGDVAAHHCGRLSRLLGHRPFKLVVLHRSRDAVVASWRRKMPDSRVNRFHPRYKNLTAWATYLPTAEIEDQQEAFEWWYDTCYRLINEAIDLYNYKVGEDFFDLDTEALNDDYELRRLFEFLEIPGDDQVLLASRHFNKGI